MRFFLITILLVMSAVTARPVYFNHLGVKDGLPQLSVHAIYQDKLGRIWFGTEEGVCIYNGEEIVNYKNYSQLLNRSVTNYTVNHITGTDEGDVFFTIGNLLVRYDLKEDCFYALKTRISSLQKAQNQIFLSSGDSIFTWNPAEKSIDLFQVTGVKDNITSVCYDSRKQLWIGTRKGLYRMEQGGEKQCVIPEKDISVLFESSTYDVWIGTRLSGLYLCGTDNKLTEFVSDKNENSISHNYIRSIVEDYSGNIWIGTFYGLNKYDPVAKHFSSYKKDHVRGSLTHSSILSLFVDKQAVLWAGTYYGGVNYFNSRRNMFNFYSDDPLRKECLNFPIIGQMTEDNAGNLWICTDGGGLNKLDRKTGLFSYYTASSGGNSIKHNNLKCIDYDPEENQLYIGTYTGGLCRLDISSDRFYNYIDKEPHSAGLHTNISWLRVYKEYVIFVDDYGLFKLKKGTGEITPLFPGSDEKTFYGNQFIIDSKDNLWLAHFSSITRIPLKEPSARQTYSTGEKGLGAAFMTSLVEVAGNKIFVTTAGDGIFLYNENDDNFTNYNAEKEQLLSDFCYSMAEAQNGNLIISCNKGLSIMNPETGEQVFSASIVKDLPFSAINSGCGIYRCRNKEVFVGSADGMISFWEDNIIWNDKNYDLYFSNLAINHKTITPSDQSGILTVIPAYTAQLTLSHEQNNLILSFASNNSLQSNNSSVYEYKLDGFDPEWIPTHNMHLSYTNLSPGDYTLHVREKKAENDQLKEIRMAITILPPFYNTPLAWVLYIALFSGLLYAFLSFRQRRVKLEASLEYERKEKEYITNLNKAKISFFTNVSHEFRTPLSLIISQIELLLNGNTVSLAVRNQINKVYKTTFQMQNLINELLDFQKAEQKQACLNVSEQDLIPFLRNIYIFFEEKAQTNQIRYSFSTLKDSIPCWFDPKQLQKVVSNVLSNAFKFTPVQGSIELVADVVDEQIVIKVIDSGIGIDKKDLSTIFERYYQASNSFLSSQKEFSTGLGLALCKEIIELHHGKIQVESKLNYGSIFIITLLPGKLHFEKDAHVKIGETAGAVNTMTGYMPVESVALDDLHDLEVPALQKEDESRYKILIVEDNRELQETLNALFSPFYQVLQAYDGVEGLRIAHEEEPDIIVSDIMMPGMYGDQMCFELKQNIATCHIPVVLLTALSSTEDNIEGLMKGADDYITKPFNTKILLVKCNNLIRNRLLQQQKYQHEPASTMQLLANNETDKKFLQKVESVIETYLSDTEFSIDKLAEEVAISRRSLFSKFKQLTGMTPNDFILNYKLKKAAFLLKDDTNLQIAEIADMLGFGSPRYFSRCFKNQFNASPMEYRNSRG